MLQARTTCIVVVEYSCRHLFIDFEITRQQGSWCREKDSPPAGCKLAQLITSTLVTINGSSVSKHAHEWDLGVQDPLQVRILEEEYSEGEAVKVV